MERPSWAPEGIDIERPSPARMLDYALGGSHNFAADRELLAQMIQVMPDLVTHARASRAFMYRAVNFCVQAGVRQFLNLGSGIPTRGSAHEVAQRAAPEARVMYVDIDPVAVAHSRAILAGNDRAGVIQADAGRLEHILTHPDVRGMLSFDQPTAILLLGVVHLIVEDLTGIVAAYRDAVAPGSYLAITHPTAEPRPSQIAGTMQMTQRGGGFEWRPRSRAEVLRLFTGFELVEPGLVWTHEWRPDHGPTDDLDPPFIVAGIGRKT